MGRYGVHYPRRIRRRLISGEIKDYYYDRKTGKPVVPDLEELEAIPAQRGRRLGARWGVTYGPEMSLSMLIGQFQASPEWTELAAATQSNYDRTLSRPELQALMRLKVGELTRERVSRLRQAIAEAGRARRGQHATGAANMFLNAIGALYAWARANRGIGELHPCRGIKPYPVQRGHALWSQQDLDAWYAAAPAPFVRAIRLGMVTAARISDLIRMRWSDYDQDACALRFTPQKTLRHRQTLAIALPPDWRPVLAEWRGAAADDATILVGPDGEPWRDTHHFDREMLRRRRALGLPAKTMHGVRATAASRLVEAGVSARHVMALTGHRTEKSFLAYIRYADQQQMASVATDALARQPWARPN